MNRDANNEDVGAWDIEIIAGGQEHQDG